MTRPASTPVIVFLFAAAVALLFALFTEHAWEDYYITWRSSKNLATGHGLVFNHGERLHTFTSPLGVLLPAAASLLTLNSSDAAALWLFRLMSCAALGGAAVLLLRLAQRRGYARLAVILMIGWLALDSKTVDFAINGMETAFLILFLAYALWAHLHPSPTAWKHLGAAWAGLMWTRPDSFIPIGLLAAGFWLFHDSARDGVSRRDLLLLHLKAGLLTTALYGPWLLIAWGYYGTPIPHTITAKSGIGDPRTLAGLLHTALHLPFTAWTGAGSVEGTFLPAYHVMGTWPAQLVQSARGLAAVTALLWLLPFLRTETRAASFAFFGTHAYLSYYPYFPFPWYLPGPAFLAIFCLGSLLAQALAAAGAWQAANIRSRRPAQILGSATVVVLLILAANLWLTWESARVFAAQQRLVEDGNRRKIGEWLRANSRPGDAVFMEPLGYIGYFSGLKTFDFPGMSSREMTEARKLDGLNWAKLITRLKPRWLVLRPHEAQRITDDDYDLLTSDYALIREFSVAREVAALDIRGRPYLEHDARFSVYERQPEKPRTLPLQDESPFAISRISLEDGVVTFAHAPSLLVRSVPDRARRGSVRFGFVPDAYADLKDGTDGAVFIVELHSNGTFTELARRTLDPVRSPEDRGLQTMTFELPVHTAEAHLILRIDAGKNMTKDWTCWGDPKFE
jgi:hypothetical protein